MAASAPSQAWPRRPSVAGVSTLRARPAVANGRVPTTRARAFDALREIPGDALRSWTFEERRANLAAALDEGNGLVIVRGLHDLTPAELVDISRSVGPDVERNPGVDPRYLVPDWPEVQVIGNVRDDAGELRAMFSRAPPLPLDERGRPTLRYDPESRSPVWHTDQAFRDPPPFASLLYCVVAPPPSAGGHTAFADCTAAYESLPETTRASLADLRAVCSYAHHNAKVRLRTPTYPLLTPEQRAKHPPVYQPVARVDPRTGRRSLYGFSSAVCAVVPEGTVLDDDAVDRHELEGWEDPSVRERMYGELLPKATAEAFTRAHAWTPGDLVVWDNLRTIHAATPFEGKHDREMWRTTVASRWEDA